MTLFNKKQMMLIDFDEASLVPVGTFDGVELCRVGAAGVLLFVLEFTQQQRRAYIVLNDDVFFGFALVGLSGTAYTEAQIREVIP